MSEIVTFRPFRKGRARNVMGAGVRTLQQGPGNPRAPPNLPPARSICPLRPMLAGRIRSLFRESISVGTAVYKYDLLLVRATVKLSSRKMRFAHRFQTFDWLKTVVLASSFVFAGLGAVAISTPASGASPTDPGLAAASG